MLKCSISLFICFRIFFFMFSNKIFCPHPDVFQAQAALMYDAVFVLVEAFNKIIRKKPDQFRSYTMRRQQNVNGNGTKVLECNTAKGWVTPWEHGDKISRYLRKVRTN